MNKPADSPTSTKLGLYSSHYNDTIMSTTAYQSTGVSMVCSTGAQPFVQAQINENVSIWWRHHTMFSEVTHRVKGTFLEVCFFPFMPNKIDPDPGVMHINCFSGATTRKIFFEHTKRLYRMREDAVSTVELKWR